MRRTAVASIVGAAALDLDLAFDGIERSFDLNVSFSLDLDLSFDLSLDISVGIARGWKDCHFNFRQQFVLHRCF